MKVSELIDELKRLDPNMEVYAGSCDVELIAPPVEIYMEDGSKAIGIFPPEILTHDQRS